MPSAFARTLHDYLRAGYPALAVDTYEEERLLADLKTLRELGWSHVVYTVTRGWADADGHPIADLPGRGNPLEALGAVREGQTPRLAVAVFLDLHPYFAVDPQLVRATRDALDVAKATQRPMLFAGPCWQLPLELRKDVAFLDYPLPDRTQLLEVLTTLLEANRDRVERARRQGKTVEAVTSLPDALAAAILDSARGLTWNEAENAIALALIRDAAAPERMPDTVRREKTQAVRKSGLLELLEPAETLAEVGGLEPLKRWLGVQGHLLQHADRALAWGLTPADLPRGTLLVGIPGTGKSLVARAVAGQWRLPLLRLDLSAILGSLVGQSEHQLRQALQLAEAMAPAVLHVDELEKALAGSEARHDSGVMAHLLGMLLTWLQERSASGRGPRAPVFVVATANRVQLLPPELYRPGRFDRVWFLDLGGAAERAQVLAIHLAKRRQRVPPEALEALASDAHTAQWSPAELELCVQSACRRAFVDGRPLEPDDLFAAAAEITPYARSHQELLDDLRRFASRFAEPAQTAPARAALGGRRLLDA